MGPSDDTDFAPAPPGSISCLTLSVDDAALVLGIGRNQAYEAVRRGDIPSIKIGKRLLVPKAQLDRLLSGEAK